MGLNLDDNKRPYSPNLGLNEVFDEIQSAVNALTPTYTSYVASLTQTGTTAPTAVIHENTLGYTPIFTYDRVGNYSMTITGNFDYLNSVVFISTPSGSINFINAYIWTDGVLYLESYTPLEAGVNDIFLRAGIEIRVYN